MYGSHSKIFGILWFLALKRVGNAVSEDEEIAHEDDGGSPRVYTAGFAHSDIARRNLCRSPRTEGSDVFLVDSPKRSQPSGKPSELDDEMNEVDTLQITSAVSCIKHILKRILTRRGEDTIVKVKARRHHKAAVRACLRLLEQQGCAN